MNKASGGNEIPVELFQILKDDAVKVNFQMFKLVLEKAEEPEIKLSTSAGSWKKQESSRKTSISALLIVPKFWKRWEYQTTWSAYWEICMQVRKQQLELNTDQQTGSI